MAKWITGRYSDHHLVLAPHIQGAVNWRILRTGKDWVASFCGESIGDFDKFAEAQQAVESHAEKILLYALAKLQGKKTG